MTTRDKVLSALRGAGRSGVSGEALAREIGVSRVAVAKHVTALKSSGYRIEAVAGLGYRLLEAPDLPLPAEVAPLLSSERWMRLEGGAETSSTNDDCKALARAGAPEGTVVLASRQTAGRGRLGRHWASPEGGVYVSCLLRPAAPVAEVPPLALVVALGVARGLRVLGADAHVKWPNDVVTPSGKLAGVLLETAAESDRVEWVVAGFGVNVRPGLEVVPGAAYLEELAGRGMLLAEVAAACLDGVAQTYDSFVVEGFRAMRAPYSELMASGGGAATVKDATGRVLGAGAILGVDDDGRLLLETATGTQAFSSGEVTLKD